MRSISPTVQLMLEQEQIALFRLVKIVTQQEILMHTDAAYDIVIPTLGTFLSDNTLLELEYPKLSTTVDREIYKIVYADPTFEFRNRFERVMTGALVTVYGGFYNTTGSPVTSYSNTFQPNQPITNIEDLVIGYEGTVDTHGLVIDPDNESIMAAIECASPMTSLGLVRSFYTSKDSLRQVNSVDTAFDQVHLGSNQITHLWGKA